MKERPPVKILDMAIILLALCLTGFSTYRAYIKPQNSSQIMIRGTDRQWIYPLDAEETVIVAGPLGETVIRIQGKEAWVESSPCANQTCVGAGHIKRQGVWTACLPNNVFLMIEGTDEETLVDGTAW